MMILFIRVNKQGADCETDEDQRTYRQEMTAMMYEFSLEEIQVTQKSDHPDWDFLGNKSATDDCEPSTDDVSEDSSQTDSSHVIDASHHYGGQLGPGEWEKFSQSSTCL